MQLQRDEYTISEDRITISKSALEEWRNHYQRVAQEYELLNWTNGLYIGKADVLIDLLKHFEPLEG